MSIGAQGGDATLVQLRAQSVYLLAQQKVVHFVACSIVSSSLGHKTTLGRGTLRAACLHLGVGLDQLLLSLCLVLSELLRRLASLMHMAAEVVLTDELENVCVEGRHRRLDVVKEVSLLDVAAVDLHKHLLEELTDAEAVLVDLLLDDVGDHLSLRSGESSDRFLGEAVSLDRLKPIVALLGVVHNHDTVLELLG